MKLQGKYTEDLGRVTVEADQEVKRQRMLGSCLANAMGITI